MKYSKDEIITAAKQEVEAWKGEGEKKRTDWDYEKLGFVHSVVNRLETNSQNIGNTVLVEGRKPIFHCIMDRNKFGLTVDEARHQDMADEYAILAEPEANGGLIVYGKYNGEWIVNPWNCRFLVRELLEQIDIRLPPLH